MISFNSLVDGFVLKSPEKYKTWLQEIISKEHHKLVGDIGFIFMDDASLHEMNKNFLEHDTYKDIITFNTASIKEIISGEVYISIERVEDNSKLRNINFYNELARVMAHGILHLIGYDDSTDEEKVAMRRQEDYCLNLLP